MFSKSEIWYCLTPDGGFLEIFSASVTISHQGRLWSAADMIDLVYRQTKSRKMMHFSLEDTSILEMTWNFLVFANLYVGCKRPACGNDVMFSGCRVGRRGIGGDQW